MGNLTTWKILGLYIVGLPIDVNELNAVQKRSSKINYFRIDGEKAEVNREKVSWSDFIGRQSSPSFPSIVFYNGLSGLL